MIAARITYAHAADRHDVGWMTDILAAIAAPRAGLHHVEHRAALVEATQVDGAESQWLEVTIWPRGHGFAAAPHVMPVVRPNAHVKLPGALRDGVRDLDPLQDLKQVHNPCNG